MADSMRGKKLSFLRDRSLFTREEQSQMTENIFPENSMSYSMSLKKNLIWKIFFAPDSTRGKNFTTNIFCTRLDTREKFYEKYFPGKLKYFFAPDSTRGKNFTKNIFPTNSIKFRRWEGCKNFCQLPPLIFQME